MSIPSGGAGASPEQIRNEALQFYKAGSFTLTTAKQQGSKSRLTFALACLQKADNMLKAIGETGADNSLKKLRQEHAFLELKLSHANRHSAGTIDKLWAKVFSPPFFSSRSSELSKVSVSDLWKLQQEAKEIHKVIEDGNLNSALKIKMLQKADKTIAAIDKAFSNIQEKEKSLLSEKNIDKFRRSFKDGAHYDLLDYHFGALDAGVGERKEHLKALARLFLKGESAGVTILDQASKAFLGEELLAEEKEHMRMHQDLFWKADLTSIASLIWKDLSPDELENVKNQLILSNFQEPATKGKHSAEWVKAATAYVEHYLSSAQNNLRLTSDVDDATSSKEKAHLILELLEVKDEGSKELRDRFDQLENAIQSYRKTHERLEGQHDSYSSRSSYSTPESGFEEEWESSSSVNAYVDSDVDSLATPPPSRRTSVSVPPQEQETNASDEAFLKAVLSLRSGKAIRQKVESKKEAFGRGVLELARRCQKQSTEKNMRDLALALSKLSEAGYKGKDFPLLNNAVYEIRRTNSEALVNALKYVRGR